MFQLKENDYRRMADVQKALTETLNRINREGKPPHAGLVAFALARLCRSFIDLHNEQTQRELVATICAFLGREDVETTEDNPIIRLH